MQGDLNTIFIIILLLIVICFMKIITNNQKEIIKKISSRHDTISENSNLPINNSIKKHTLPMDNEITCGNVKIIGEDNDEVVAVIMASVSAYANVPLKSLNIKCIKKMESV